MKYYFGLVPTEDVETFGDEGLFECEGKYYYTQLEFGSNPGGMEDFTLSDCCGRSIPISVDHINSLARCLVSISNALHVVEVGHAVQELAAQKDHTVTFE